jgi:hypothetical protein
MVEALSLDKPVSLADNNPSNTLVEQQQPQHFAIDERDTEGSCTVAR